ncbi:MAG TPA: sodium:solute symporter family protein [Candidatus Tumulicola sp.]
MSGPAVALSIVAIVIVGTLGLALYGVRHIKMDPQQFIVGGRSFGTLFLWVLLAGEIYTSFTFIGAAGWAYGQGAPAYYILAYGSCAYVIGYFLLPAIWRVAKERSLLTGPDFFADRYGSQALGVGVAAVQFLVIVPYVALQLSGLQLLLRIAGYRTVDATAAVSIAFLLIALFVFTAGLRGMAWASIVKDALVLGAVAFAGIVIPIQFFGSWSRAVDQVLRVHPHFLTLVPGTGGHGTVWYVSTVLLSAIGFFMSPQGMSAIYSSRSEGTLRRNAMLLPFYGIALVLMFFAGLAALLIVPGLKGTDVDQSFLLVVQRYYPPWVMGFVAAAGSLAALIPASALLLGAASIFAKNVLGAFGIATGDAARMLATRILVIVVALLALVFWIGEQKTLVELILIYYNGVTQFAPGVVAAFVWRRATAWGVATGILAGLFAAYWLTHAATAPWGLNAGLVALFANVVVMTAVSLLTPARTAAAAVS